MKILDELSANQSANEMMAKQAIGGLWPLSSDIVRLFEVLAGLFEPDDPGHLGAVRALLFAYRASAMAIMDVVRCQFVEASGHERRMLELVALSVHFAEKPGDFKLWQSVHREKLDPRRHPRWKEYRDRFGPMATQSRLLGLSPLLADAYARCNLMVHGSVVSQVRAVEVRDEGDPDAVRLLVKFTDLEPGPVLPLVGEMLQVLNSSLVAQACVAAKYLDENRRMQWEQSLRPVTAALAVEANKWQRARTQG